MENGTAIILAGGDGTRLRAAAVIPSAHTFFSVTRRHAPYYGPALSGVPRHNVIVQPDNRGTAAAILYAVVRVETATASLATAILPADHYVSDDAVFMAHVAAMALVTGRPDLIVLLGIEPDRPETDYGWIEPAEPLSKALRYPVHRVRRFWEKPDVELAHDLVARGCFWNSFGIVANPTRLRRVISSAVPGLARAFAPLVARMGTPWEMVAAQDAYAGIGTIDFSRHVVEPNPDTLAVMPVGGLQWNDLGNPSPLRSTRVSVESQLVTA